MAAKAGRLQIQLEMQVAELRRDLAAVRGDIARESAGWRSMLSEVGIGFKEAFTIGAVDQVLSRVTDAVINTTRELMTNFDTIADGSKRIGASAEEYQKLAFAFEQTGSSAEGMEGIILKMQKSIGSGSKAVSAALGELGLSLTDLRAQTPAAQFEAIASALAGVEDPTKRAALASAVLGRSWSEAAPLIAEGAGAVTELMGAAERLGIVLSDETVKAGEAFNDQLSVMKQQGKALLSEFIGPIIDQLQKLTVQETNAASGAVKMGEGMEYARRVMRTLGQMVALVAQIFVAQQKVLSAWAVTAITNARAVFEVFSKGFEAMTTINPVERLQRFAELGAVVVRNFDEVATNTGTALEFMGGQISGIVEQIKQLGTAAPDVVIPVTTTPDLADVETQVKDVKKAVTETAEAFDAAAVSARLLRDQEKAIAEMRGDQEKQTAYLVDYAKELGDVTRELNDAKAMAAGATQYEIDLQNANGDATLELIAAKKEELRVTYEQIDMQQQLADGIMDVAMAFTQGSKEGVDALKQLVAQMLIAIATAKILQAFGLGSAAAANGAVFQGTNAQFFAQGGVVHGPTAFAFAGGRLGVMGEAGPEAIMPLERTAGGQLGVKAVGAQQVQIYNYGAQVETDNTGETLRIVINTVRDSLAGDIAAGGNPFASAFERTYGVRR